jgi:hypothetical protein
LRQRGGGRITTEADEDEEDEDEEDEDEEDEDEEALEGRGVRVVVRERQEVHSKKRRVACTGRTW